jgi:hypothetical protein
VVAFEIASARCLSDVGAPWSGAIGRLLNCSSESAPERRKEQQKRSEDVRAPSGKSKTRSFESARQAGRVGALLEDGAVGLAELDMVGDEGPVEDVSARLDQFVRERQLDSLWA